MELVIAQRDHWQTILRRQQLANAKRWLSLIQHSEDSQQVILENYDNLLRALEFALQDVQTFHLSFELIQALHTLVLGYADWDRWLNYLETALHTAQQLQDEAVCAHLLEQCADVAFQMGDLARAKILYQRAGHIYERLHDRDNHARMLIKLGPILGSQGKLAEAIALCQQAYKLAQSSGNRWLMASANLNLSHIQYTAYNWQVGLQAAQKAYDLYRAQNKPEFAAKALGNMITGWAQLQEWDKADVASAELLEILTASGNIHALTVLKNTLGVIAYNQSNYRAAELAWQEALQLAQQMQAPDQSASLYNNLGKLYTEMEEWGEAARMLEQAIDIYQTLGDTYNWANSMDNLADLYEAQGLMALCRETLETAVSTLSTLEPNFHVQTLLQTMHQRLA
ncbi:MAG: tetratricopeptide repeat protein [Chloroflexota bacterium]